MQPLAIASLRSEKDQAVRFCFQNKIKNSQKFLIRYLIVFFS